MVSVLYQLVSPKACGSYSALVETRQRILDGATESFGTDGYDATSLDALASDLGVSKQTVLYHFGSKDRLLEAAIDHAAVELMTLVEKRIADTTGWPAVEAVVSAVFRVAMRRPALLGLLREVMRLGAPWSTRASSALDPLVVRARDWLEAEMDAGRMRRTDPRLLLVSAYSTVMGVATEVEVLRAVGIEPTLRATVARRRELINFLRSALVTPGLA